MFLSWSYCILLIFHRTSFCWNNHFKALKKKCIPIFRHLNRYMIPFSVTELPQLFKIAWLLLTNFSLLLYIFVWWYLSLGSELANSLIWWHIHQPDYFTRSVVPCWKSHLQLSLIVNVPSATVYLTLIKLPSFNYNFLELSLFMYCQSIRILQPNFTVFVISNGSFSFPVGLMTNTGLLEYNCIIVSLLNVIFKYLHAIVHTS